MDAKLKSLISKIKKEHDDDAVDRSIYATTVYILGFFAVLIMARQYVGEPLQCWIPAEYTGAWEAYIENYCFVENTYFVNRTIPEDRPTRKRYELRYYQWIPYLLSIQALICYAPKLIFKLLYSLSDLRVTDLVQLAYKECKEKFSSGVEKKIALQLLEKSQIKVQLHFNWYLTAIYLLMKVLNIVALVAQLGIMNYFVADNDFFWGVDVLVLLWNGGDWRTTGVFPRVTFCDLRTRDLGQMREHTVQCVLMINMFAEKIYIFLWLWSLALLFAAVLNLVYWLYRTFVMSSKVRMVKDALKLHHEKPSGANVEKFIDRFLKLDGMLVLRLIDSNAGYVHMADILCELWRNYGKKNDISAPPALNPEKLGQVLLMQSIARIIDKVKSRHDDDFVDRANYVYTALMFGTFALITAAKQYVGEPLQCWIPADFKGPWEKYSESYCFVENTYYVNVHDPLPKSQVEREKRELQYYQWVCFMMVGQMIFFILPKAVWNALNLKTGLAIQSLISTSKLTIKKGNGTILKDNPKQDVIKAKDYMQTLNKFNKERAQCKQTGPIKPSFWTGYITKLYLLYKMVNVMNAVVQLYALNQFLGPKYTFWGWGLFMDLVQGRQWQESGHFPRVTFCDVDVRLAGGVSTTYTLQCVLMINMFNEKIYLFIWFWLLALTVANALNLLQWMVLALRENNAVEFVRTQLAYKNVNLDYEETQRFMEESLFLDAITTLRLVQLNCGDFVSSDLVHHLYLDHRPSPSSANSASVASEEKDRSAVLIAA